MSGAFQVRLETSDRANRAAEELDKGSSSTTIGKGNEGNKIEEEKTPKPEELPPFDLYVESGASHQYFQHIKSEWGRPRNITLVAMPKNKEKKDEKKGTSGVKIRANSF